MRIFHRTALGGSAGAGIATCLGLVLAATSSAATPTLGVTATDAIVGQAIHATAQLSESTDASGEISFEVFGPGDPGDPDCSGPDLTPAPASASVDGDGEYSSGNFTPPVAGSYFWSAHYPGDVDNDPAESICSAVSTVDKASPSLAGSATSGVTVGSTITDEATLTGGFEAGGQLVFRAFGPNNQACAGAPKYQDTVAVDGNGSYSPSGFAPVPAGLYRWTVEYEGDQNNKPADLGCGASNQSSAVNRASPILSGLATSVVTVGSPIHDEVTFTGAFSPTGEVTFKVFGPTDTDCSVPLATDAVPVQGGQATSANFLAQQAGEFRWTADYPGDANNEPASLPCNATNQTSTVNKDSPNLSGSATSTVMVGSTITDEATLSGGFQAGGQLVFRAFGPGNETCTGTPQHEEAVAVNGNGSYSPAGFIAAPAGSYRWTVAYEGDGNNEPASLPCNAANQTSTVNKDSPNLSGAATSTVTVGSTITDEATLTGGFQPSGQLVFRAFGPGNETCMGTPQYQEAVAVNGNGSYSPAGFVASPAGLYRWTVEYGGDASNEPDSLGCNAAGQSSTVNKASPSLAGIASSAVVGSPIHDEVTLTGDFSPTGEVTFSVYGPTDTGCSTPLVTGSVPIQGNHATSANFLPQQAGEFRWTADYPGDANNEPASLPCGATNQTSIASKASPNLSGTATSAITVGEEITDNVTLTGGFEAGGQLTFRAFGPNDQTCATTPKYEDTVTVNGDGSYSPSPPEFVPALAGLYRWTVEYGGDANNEPASLPCGTTNQASAVGTVSVTLSASATSATVGGSVTAMASIQEGAIPAGQITFKAFPPSDATCSGAAAFSSTVGVSGLGSYRSAAFVPPRVGIFRWTVGYSGDPNHAPAAVGCGGATSGVSQARPTIATGAVGQRFVVGAPFRAAATLQGGFAPAGTVTFRIYGPGAGDCVKPLSVNTVAIAGNGAFLSDPFVPQRPGRYRFVASYSGDASNQGAAEACGLAGQIAQAQKRTPKVKPRARLSGRQISIRARLSGTMSPSGAITFRLYGPGNKRCKAAPAFSGSIGVKSNGSYLLAKYLATQRGIYRLSVGYSGDLRNRRDPGSCRAAQLLQVD